jgi:hypothetical protein
MQEARMPYEVRWESEPHIVFFKMFGVFTEAEMDAATDEMIGMAQAHPDVLVHTLIDASEIQQLPPLPVMGRELRRLMGESPNRNVSTLYGVSPLVRFSLEILMKITPLRLKVFPSREEALAFTHKMVESERNLPDITPLRADQRKDFYPVDES